MLEPHAEGVVAGEEGCSGRRAHLLHVRVVQVDSRGRQLVDVGSVHVFVSEPDVIPSKVVGHEDHDVGSVRSLFSSLDEEADEEDPEGKSLGHRTRIYHCDVTLKEDRIRTRCSHTFVKMPRPVSKKKGKKKKNQRNVCTHRSC